MEKSKVYFTDFRTPYGGASMPQKLQKLMKKAGIGDIDFEKQFVAIKMHFGELGNISYLRPNYAKAVVDLIQTKVAFLYTSVDSDVKKVLEGAKEELGTAPIIGCTSSAGIIVPDGFISSENGFTGILAIRRSRIRSRSCRIK